MPNSQKDNQEIIKFQQQQFQKAPVSLAYPWYQQITQKLSDPILRMHNQAIQFYLYTAPTKQQQETNMRLYECTSRIIHELIPTAVINAPFLVNQLYMRQTQPQIYIYLDETSKQNIQNIRKTLQNYFQITSSSLPNTFQKYQINQWQFDLNQYNKRLIIRIFSKQTWLQWMNYIDQSYKTISQLKYLFPIFNCMIRQRGFHINIRSYLLYGLFSVFYHERKKQRHRSLTENILKFIQYYGVGPFQQRKIMYYGKNSYSLIQQGQGPSSFSFFLNQKINLNNHVLRDFFNLLKNRYRLISNYNFDDQQSTIGALVNPCQKQFSYI